MCLLSSVKGLERRHNEGRRPLGHVKLVPKSDVRTGEIRFVRPSPQRSENMYVHICLEALDNWLGDVRFRPPLIEPQR